MKIKYLYVFIIMMAVAMPARGQSITFGGMVINIDTTTYTKKSLKELKKSAEAGDKKAKKKLASYYCDRAEYKKAKPLLEDLSYGDAWAAYTLWNMSRKSSKKEDTDTYASRLIQICKKVEDGESYYYCSRLFSDVWAWGDRPGRYPLRYSLSNVANYLYCLKRSAELGYFKMEEWNKEVKIYLDYGETLWGEYNKGGKYNYYKSGYENLDKSCNLFDLVEYYYALVKGGVPQAFPLFDKYRYMLDDSSVQINSESRTKWVNQVVSPWFKNAKKNEDAVGMYMLAWFNNLIGLSDNFYRTLSEEECENYFQIAATKEYPPAQYEWGKICYGKKLYFDAFEWYMAAARRGNEQAALAVGNCYNDGIGTDKNQDKAIQWYWIASRLGEEQATDVLESIYKKIQPGMSYMAWYQSINPPEDLESEPVAEQKKPAPAPSTRPLKRDDGVDRNIPRTSVVNDKTFAVIIGNENYQQVAKVPYANKDAEIFAAYCRETLGLPEKNIRSYADATYGTMMMALKDIKQIAEAYGGDLNVIFYYAGHGVPNESDFSAFLLPVDVDGSQTDLCLSVNELYRELNSLKAHNVVVFMDACFSGAQRGGGMLASARGVALKAKNGVPQGNMVVFSAATGDQTAYPYQEKGHGLFTYFLLKKLQESEGKATLGEITDYVSEQVARQSVVVNGKSQIPVVTPSASMSDSWKTMTLR